MDTNAQLQTPNQIGAKPQAETETPQKMAVSIYIFMIKIIKLIRTNNLVLFATFMSSVIVYTITIYYSAKEENETKKFPKKYTFIWIPILALIFFTIYIFGRKLIRYTVLNIHSTSITPHIVQSLPLITIFLIITTIAYFIVTEINKLLKENTKSSNSTTSTLTRVFTWISFVVWIIFTIYSFQYDGKYMKASIQDYNTQIRTRAIVFKTLYAKSNYDPNKLFNLSANKQQTLFSNKSAPKAPEALTSSYTIVVCLICGLIAFYLGKNIFTTEEKNLKKSKTYVLQFLIFASIASYGSIKLFQMILKMYYVSFFNLIGRPVNPMDYSNSKFARIVLALTVIGVIMLGAQVIQTTYLIETGKKENDAEFEKDRCNITNMLLFPYIKPNTPKYKEMTFSQNWSHCMKQKQNVFVMTFLQPFYDIFHNIMEVFTSLFENITDLRQAVTNVRVYFANMSQELYTKMRNDYQRLAYLKNVFTRIFSKVFDGMYNMFYGFLYTYYTIRSLLSPLMPIADFFCFAPTTLITTDKAIKDYKVGDIMPDGAKVLSTMVFSAENIQMYNYKGVIVAGSHLVNVQIQTDKGPINRWERIENVKTAVPLLKSEYAKHHQTVICLRTSNSTIKTLNGVQFADYDETANPIINATIQSTIIDHLNKNRTHTQIDKDASTYHHWGFHPDTIIDFKPISQYKIGDKLASTNAYVTGIIEMEAHNIYEYHNILVTGNQIVYDPINRQYTTVSQLKDAKQLSKSKAKSDTFINLTTTNNRIVINGVTFTDFEQSSDETLNDTIDNFVQKYKNHEIPASEHPFPAPDNKNIFIN